MSGGRFASRTRRRHLRYVMRGAWPRTTPVCDARSIAPQDFVPTDLKYSDRTGEVYSLAFNPAHRWYYIPGMRAEEAMLIKCYDSAQDGRARFSAHGAFEDPTTRPGANPRE